MKSKGEASPQRGPERKRTERMANTSNSQLNGVNPPIIYPGSSSPPLPPSTPSAQDIISPSSHHPPPPVRFMLLHVHTNPEQDSNAVIRASLSSPSRPPSSHHHQPSQTRPASHTVPPKRCRRRYPAHPASSSHPYETHLSSRVHVLQKTPKRNARLPFPGRWWSTPPKIPKNHAQTKSSLYQTHNPIFNTLTQCTTPPLPSSPAPTEDSPTASRN